MSKRGCSRVCDLDMYATVLLLIIVALTLMALLAGCSYTINLTVALPTDDTPMVEMDDANGVAGPGVKAQPQMQTKPDRFDL